MIRGALLVGSKLTSLLPTVTEVPHFKDGWKPLHINSLNLQPPTGFPVDCGISRIGGPGWGGVGANLPGAHGRDLANGL
jgi:hypothetical protein